MGEKHMKGELSSCISKLISILETEQKVKINYGRIKNLKDLKNYNIQYVAWALILYHEIGPDINDHNKLMNKLSMFVNDRNNQVNIVDLYRYLKYIKTYW